MKKRILQNYNLDKIGRKLLETGKMESNDIEQIVTSEHLFNSIKANIKAEQVRRERLNQQGLFPTLKWQKVGFVFGALAVILIGLIGASLFTSQDKSFLLAEQITQAEKMEIKLPKVQTEIPPSPTIIKPLAFKKSAVNNLRIVSKTVLKSAQNQLTKSTPKAKFAKNQLPAKIADDEKFYPLAYSAIPNQIGEDLRVIRVDMTRTELFALGVNVSPENEYGTIKADLLVGIDNIPQAIRFVKPN